MAVTLTQAPTLGVLVGNLEAQLDQSAEGWKDHVRASAVWPAVREKVAAGMGAVLSQTELLDLLAKGWAKADALKKRALETLKQDGLETTLTFASHKQDITLDPGFALTINGVAAGKLPLALLVSVSIDGAIVSIRNLAITEVELGKVAVSAHLECAGKQTPLEMAIPAFNLLGKYPLTHPAVIERV